MGIGSCGISSLFRFVGGDGGDADVKRRRVMRLSGVIIVKRVVNDDIFLL